MSKRKRIKITPAPEKIRKDDTKGRVTGMVIALVIITGFAFYPSLLNGFTNWDDDRFVIDNRLITDLSWKNIADIFDYRDYRVSEDPESERKGYRYVPLTFLSFAVEYNFFKLSPQMYHITNLALHLLNCILVFWFVFLLSGRRLVSFVAALLFGIHPLHVESVAWVTERKDVLYSFFFMWAMICYLYYVKKNHWLYYGAVIALFCLAVLAKTMAITLPLVLFTIDYVTGRRFDRKALLEKLPFFAVALVFATITMTGNKQKTFTLLYNICIAGYGVLFYLVKLVLPVKLCSYYPHPGKPGSMPLPVLFMIAPVVAVCVVSCILYLGRHSRKIIFGFSFFFITLLPVIQLIPVPPGIAADRYMYVPSIGLLYLFGELIAWLYYEKLKKSKAGRVVLSAGIVVIAVLFSFVSWNRCKVWNNSVSLWSDVLRKYPSVTTAYINRGCALDEMGYSEKAIEDFSRALEFEPQLVMGYFNRGKSYEKMGVYTKALEDYSRAVELKPGLRMAHNGMGVSYSKLGEYDRAIACFTNTIEIDPGFRESYLNRGTAYGRIGMYEKAMEDFEKAIEIDPGCANAYYRRAAICMVTKDNAGAEGCCAKILEIEGRVDKRRLEKLCRFFAGENGRETD